MATKSTNVAKSSKSTAVATLDYSNEVAAIAKRLQVNTGNKIRVSNAKIFELPDKTEYDELDCIVLDFVARNMYYTTPYSEDMVIPPDCFAIGLEPTALVPSENSPDPQCGSCAGCAMNQFKSAANGKGKACTNTRLLAIVIPPSEVAINDDLSELPIYLLSVSPTALASFDGHVNKVANHFKKPVRTVITRISFAEDKSFPSLRFSAVAPAGQELELFAQSRLEEAHKILATEPDIAAMQAANDSRAKPAPKRGNARVAGRR